MSLFFFSFPHISTILPTHITRTTYLTYILRTYLHTHKPGIRVSRARTAYVQYTPEPEPEPEPEFFLTRWRACMHAYAYAYAGVSVCIQCRQAGYAGCFPGDKYAGMQVRYAYVGSYAGIASMDVIVCFERRGDCSLFLRVVALEMR